MTEKNTTTPTLEERIKTLEHTIENGNHPIPHLLLQTEALITEAKNSGNNDALYKLLRAKASQLYLSGKHEESKELYHAVLEQCLAGSRKDALPRVYLALGRLYSTMQDDRVALDYIRLSKAAAEEVDDKEMIAEGNMLKGITLAKSQQYNEALDAYNEAARYSYETNNARRMGAIFFLMAQLHHHADNFHSAKESCELAIKYFTECDNKRGILIATTRFASIISALEEHTRALEILDEHEGQVTQFSLPYISCGFYTIKAEILLSLKEYEQCEKTLLLAHHFALQSNNPRNLLDLYTTFISLYLKTNRISEAREYLQQAYTIAKDNNDSHWEMKLHKHESDLYRQIGDYEQALSQYILYHEQDKKIAAETTEERLAALRVNHELIEKERESELYRLRSEKLQRELMSKSTHLASESEVLSRVRQELVDILSQPTDATTALRNIKNKIQEMPRSAVDWEEYDKHFLSAHPDFIKNLLDKFPTLSPAETKICALLRVGLTSKEIAHMLTVSERSVENHRYRIRKKIGIGDTNIIQFLNAI